MPAGTRESACRSNSYLRSIRFLGRQWLPFRGNDHRDGVLWQLMLESTHDRPDIRQWINRRNNWMSDKIQNEIVNMYGCAIQRHISVDAQSSHYYGITADGTTDAAGQDQFSVSLQFCSATLDLRNYFLRFFNAPDSTGQALAAILLDILLRLNLPVDRIQGYCFDGASNMSGRLNGVPARLMNQCPYAIYVHCANHSLDLVLQEAARDVRIVADTLSFVRET